MFKIGDFSRVARVSARLLRFYDEIGLLRPAHADPATGYRYYAASQLPQLNRILVLKELGFSLEDMRPILGNQISTDELRAMLLVRRQDAERIVDAETQRLRLIEARIRQIEGEGEMTAADVVVRSEPARRYLSLRRTLPSLRLARDTAFEVRALARRCLPGAQLGALLVIAHTLEFENDHFDAEFGFVLPDDAEAHLRDSVDLTLRELEAVPRMAVCIRVGVPEEAHLYTSKIARYLEASGDELAGPNREHFLRLPSPEQMAEAVVEMQFPIRKIKST
jgi:DNA-binding transcriptional MerR regulator